jgi:hypothetical protein
MTNERDDPAERWAHLLGGLEGARRESVISALRHSAASGWPATEDGVRLLVAYAQGEIDAQDYAVQILVALHLDRPSRLEPDPEPGPELEPALRRVEVDWPGESTPEPSRPPAPANDMTHDEAVEAYVTGRIPVEEFLRVARHRTA